MDPQGELCAQAGSRVWGGPCLTVQRQWALSFAQQLTPPLAQRRCPLVTDEIPCELTFHLAPRPGSSRSHLLLLKPPWCNATGHTWGARQVPGDEEDNRQPLQLQLILRIVSAEYRRFDELEVTLLKYRKGKVCEFRASQRALCLASGRTLDFRKWMDWNFRLQLLNLDVGSSVKWDLEAFLVEPHGPWASVPHAHVSVIPYPLTCLPADSTEETQSPFTGQQVRASEKYYWIITHKDGLKELDCLRVTSNFTS
ncbi:uncharacterized protein LOC128598200 [Nycticebus coucang]|uniref:uncharacterized protein LOC128598200 n=1 Tax=Nycticebus coucang TaxID=9470 RepID=UPI00234D2524|nr:uncharacterized protein LOC128598200 [Nycticebus coucang]